MLGAAVGSVTEEEEDAIVMEFICGDEEGIEPGSTLAELGLNHAKLIFRSLSSTVLLVVHSSV